MNMIDQYIDEVGQNLPGKVRADLSAEIRSLIQDTLEDRSQAAGRAPDDDMIVEVLKEFGPPAKMAASYLPPRYLIGPRLFPFFILVVRIVGSVLGIMGLVGLGVAISEPGLTLTAGLSIFGQKLAELITSLLAALGNIVFIFAILEWALPKTTEKDTESWDPRSMKPRTDPEQIKLAGLIWEIAMILVGLLIFNIYPQLLGIYFPQNGGLTVIPILSDAFFRLLPVINVQWVLMIFLNVMLLRTGQWDNGTRWFRIALRIISVVILVAMITGDPIINLNFAQMAAPVDALRELEPLATLGLRVLLSFTLALEVFEIGKNLYQMYFRRSHTVVTQ